MLVYQIHNRVVSFTTYNSSDANQSRSDIMQISHTKLVIYPHISAKIAKLDENEMNQIENMYFKIFQSTNAGFFSNQTGTQPIHLKI